MYQLNLPSFEFKLRKIDGQAAVFDEIRKKYVLITPEEWVRQHWIKTLIEHYKCPAGRIAIEKGLEYNNTKRRTDVLVFDDQLKPLLLLELKAPEVMINENTLEQIGIYNTQLNVPWMLVSNGVKHYVFKHDLRLKKTELVEELPSYQEMQQPH